MSEKNCRANDAVKTRKKMDPKRKALQKHFSEVRCPGCGRPIDGSDDMSKIEYVRTKRATDVFFHTECFGKVWHREL